MQSYTVGPLRKVTSGLVDARIAHTYWLDDAWGKSPGSVRAQLSAEGGQLSSVGTQFISVKAQLQSARAQLSEASAELRGGSVELSRGSFVAIDEGSA